MKSPNKFFMFKTDISYVKTIKFDDKIPKGSAFKAKLNKRTPYMITLLSENKSTRTNFMLQCERSFFKKQN